MRTSRILRFLLFSNFVVLLVFAYTLYIEFDKSINNANPFNTRTTKMIVGAVPFAVSMIYLLITYFRKSDVQDESDVLDDYSEKKRDEFQ